MILLGAYACEQDRRSRIERTLFAGLQAEYRPLDRQAIPARKWMNADDEASARRERTLRLIFALRMSRRSHSTAKTIAVFLRGQIFIQ
ncbi:hypothetical protein E4K66_13970 [Bradyrhizobium frederickii]|uniref:Uncharacterized protein n=1 Tax=Bradyrhizobium frederickii TaxID=2560054 RepID=A0A4Y9LCK9_9BRAD|nr:hypothetical protein [Bradyrhizobium frederickii]TFV39492.1 hypothetical protein E4K66_13970 [Bradyrhizobium frederickii]